MIKSFFWQRHVFTSCSMNVLQQNNIAVIISESCDAAGDVDVGVDVDV